MRNFHTKKTSLKEHCPIINIEDLWALLGDRSRQYYAKEGSGRAPVLDVVRHGFFKVLGKGLLPKQPLIVKARFFSQEAEKKIKAAGGVCVLTA